MDVGTACDRGPFIQLALTGGRRCFDCVAGVSFHLFIRRCRFADWLPISDDRRPIVSSADRQALLFSSNFQAPCGCTPCNQTRLAIVEAYNFLRRARARSHLVL